MSISTQQEIWVPDESTLHAGGRAYVTYATGVAILHSPTEQVGSLVAKGDFTEDGTPTSERNLEVLVAGAEKLLWHGLKKVVEYANDPKSHVADRALNHAAACTVIDTIIEYATDSDQNHTYADQLFKLEPAFIDLPPMPLVDEGLYKRVVRSARSQVKTESLMGDFAIHEALQGFVQKRRSNLVTTTH